MKILVVCQFYYPERFVINKIAEELVKKGHEVDVLTGKPNYGYGYILPEYKHIREEMINGVTVYRVNLYPRKHTRLSIIRNYLSFYFNSKKWVRKCKKEYDVVYSMSLSPVTILAAGNLYKKKHHVPHVVHCVDLWPESPVATHAVKRGSLIYKLLYRWSRKLYMGADKILVGSPSFSEYFADILKLPTNNISYVPQCSLIDDEDITEYDFGPGKHILYCGNLGFIQLIPLITEAMTLFNRDDVYFHIIGMGQLENFLKEDIKKRGLEKNVIYHGPMSAKLAASYYKGADAIYISLKNEEFVGKTIPNKLEMSLIFGKPIIAVLKGDGRKVLQEAGGAIFAEENANSIKDAIVSFLNLSHKEIDTWKMSYPLYYLNNFSVRRVTDLVEKSLSVK